MNEERDGLTLLKESIEEVAADIESHRRPRPRSALRALLAAAALLIVLFLGYQFLHNPRTAEVEVIELRIEGRPVGARIVEGAAPSTIIIVPEQRGPVVAASAACFMGGTK
jgi:hypothetical protein